MFLTLTYHSFETSPSPLKKGNTESEVNKQSPSPFSRGILFEFINIRKNHFGTRISNQRCAIYEGSPEAKIGLPVQFPPVCPIYPEASLLQLFRWAEK